MSLKRIAASGIIPLLSTCSLIGASESRLVTAARDMDRASVLSMLEQGTDVNAADVEGMRALHWAVYQDDVKTAELLVRAGASVNAANRYGTTPLSLACTNGNERVVALLLKAGADPNTTLPGGETASMTAARTGRAGP